MTRSQVLEKHEYKPLTIMRWVPPICSVCGNPKFQPWVHANLRGRQCAAEGLGGRCQYPAGHKGAHAWSTKNGWWGAWTNWAGFKKRVAAS